MMIVKFQWPSTIALHRGEAHFPNCPIPVRLPKSIQIQDLTLLQAFYAYVHQNFSQPKRWASSFNIKNPQDSTILFLNQFKIQSFQFKNTKNYHSRAEIGSQKLACSSSSSSKVCGVGTRTNLSFLCPKTWILLKITQFTSWCLYPKHLVLSLWRYK